jgi:hypothetical protein
MSKVGASEQTRHRGRNGQAVTRIDAQLAVHLHRLEFVTQQLEQLSRSSRHELSPCQGRRQLTIPQ